jgi:putative peptidoglycan lipid II flippase
VDHALASQPPRTAALSRARDVSDLEPDAPVAVEPEHGETRRILRASALVGIGTAISRITGFLRVSALAALGFARLTDVYNIANSTPNIVYELLLGGILSATLVPLYVEHLHHDDERASDAINTVAIVGLLAVTAIGILCAPWIVDVYTLRLHGPTKAAQQALATDLLRLFMPQVFFYGLTTIATAMLNARRRFAAAAFAPAINNVVVIGVLLAVPRVTTGTLTVDRVLNDGGLTLLLGVGTTAGVVATALVLLPALRGSGARFHWVWAPRDAAVRKLARLSSWTVGYVVANQVAFLVVLLLSYGKSGDASVYLAAFTFFQLPHGLFAVSLMTTLAPELAAAASRKDLSTFRDRFSSGLRLVSLVILPSSAILTVLARPIVNALLDYGDFSRRSAALTAQTLAWFAISLLFFSVYLFTLRGYYALQDTRTPFVLNCLENGVNVVAALALWPLMGVQGLALAWSIAYGVGAVVSLLAFRRRLGRLEGRVLVESVLRVGAATAALAVVAWGVATAVGYGTPARAIVATAAASLAGLGAFLAVARLLGVAELSLLVDAVRRRRGASAARV